jgi:hypothetical protein
MIIENITCDYEYCETTVPMDHGMVPESWVRYEGKQYCMPGHFIFTIDMFSGAA